MSLLTGLFFIGLLLLACFTYLTLEHQNQAELSAYRQLAQIQQAIYPPQVPASIPPHLLEPSGFFAIGTSGLVESDASNASVLSRDRAA
jgi:hypothetical protein